MSRDTDSFVAAQRQLRKEWGFESFNAALRSWIATVAIVEVEYVGEAEEYYNELTARDYLEELARRSPDYWARRAAPEVAYWDERFRDATTQDENPWLPPLDGPAGWWQYRTPRRWRKPSEDQARF